MIQDNSPHQKVDIFSFYKMFWARILDVIDKADGSVSDKLRVRHFLFIIVTGIPTMIVFGIFNLFKGNTWLVLYLVFTVFSLLGGGAYLIKMPRSKSVYRFCGSMYSSLLVYLFILGGDGGSMILWNYTFPLIAYFLMGRREGTIWAFTLITLELLVCIVPQPFFSIYPYSGEFIVRLLSTYVIVCVITAWFDYFRSEYHFQIVEGNKRFQEILEYSRDIIYRRDLKTGKYDYISLAFTTHLGYEASEVQALQYSGVEKLLHPEDQGKHQETLVKMMNNHKSAATDTLIEYRMRHKNGSYLWFSDQISYIYDTHGTPEFVVGINREITALLQTRWELKKAKDQLKTILNSIDAHVYVADMESHEILFMNNKMKEDFGSKLEGKVCWEEFRGEEGPCDHCLNEKLLLSDDEFDGMLEWECYNPLTKKWYNNFDRTIQWVDGRRVRLQIAMDMTRIKEMEEERKQNEAVIQRAVQLEAIGNLAGGIAHDFNNLLQVQLGYLSLLKHEMELNEHEVSYISELEESSFKAQELANRLITFASGGTPHKKNIDLSQFLAKVVSEQPLFETVTYKSALASDLWTVPVDNNQFQLVLKNLVENSLDAMHHEGVITFSAENYELKESSLQHHKNLPPGKYVKLAVQDTGCGITEESLLKVFDPYFSTKSKGPQKGMGLGLSIVYSIINRHDGEVDVASRLNVGTTITLFLPVEEKGEEASRYSDYSTQSTEIFETDTLLLMDDEESIRTMAKNLFSLLGYKVDTASDGAEALDMYQEMLREGKRYRGVILDLTVTEGMGGEQAMEGLLALDANVRAIVSSGYYGDPILKNFADYGFLGSLEKPYTLFEAKKIFGNTFKKSSG